MSAYVKSFETLWIKNLWLEDTWTHNIIHKGIMLETKKKFKNVYLDVPLTDAIQKNSI